MSEVTYKKIVDVEQIDTLGEGTTLFVNDGGSMKQMGVAALGAVKSVNGVLPDENGEVKATELIQFADYSAIIPGRILYGGTYTMQEIVNKLFNGEHQRYEVVISILNPMNGIQTDRKVTAYEKIVTGDDRLLTGAKLYYGDEACPIIVNGLTNTITLDPDWVKPEENVQSNWNRNDPNAADYVKNRTHWEEVTEAVTEVPDTTFTSTIDADQGVAMLSVAPNVTAIGDKREIIYDGVSYVCEAAEFQYTPGALYLGNASIMGAGDDSGEPFFWIINSKTSTTFVNTDTVATAHTVSCKTVRAETVHPLDPKFLPEDYINGLIDSNEKITALTEEIHNLSWEDLGQGKELLTVDFEDALYGTALSYTFFKVSDDPLFTIPTDQVSGTTVTLLIGEERQEQSIVGWLSNDKGMCFDSHNLVVAAFEDGFDLAEVYGKGPVFPERGLYFPALRIGDQEQKVISASFNGMSFGWDGEPIKPAQIPDAYIPDTIARTEDVNSLIDSKLEGAGSGGAKQVIFDATIDDESGEYVATCNCTFEEVLQAVTNGNAALLRYQQNGSYNMVNHNVIRLCECGYTLAPGDAEDMIVIGCGFALRGNAMYEVTMSMDGEIQVTIN